MEAYLGSLIDIVIDRPVGYVHGDIVYPVNYGYIPGTVGGDGEEIDVYVLGIDHPIDACRARVLGVIHRQDDVEEKLVAAPEGTVFCQSEILEQTWFVERFFRSSVTAMYEKSCGAVVYTMVDGQPHYLVLKSWKNGDCGFPKGHMELGETETQTPLREIMEETSLTPLIREGFRKEISYVMPNGRHKSVVFFLAEYAQQTPAHCDGFEHSDYYSLCYENAMDLLTHQTSKDVLTEAHHWLCAKRI